MSNIFWVVVAFVIYVIIMIAIGFTQYKKSQNLSDYFLGGRGLGAWVAALSAQASDMSGWLLMGLPGAVYAMGTGQIWIAVGLFIGTVLNWVFVATRLRRYTIAAGDAITIPQFFENRFRDKSGILKIVSAVFIVIFFTVYTASGFVAGGTLFSSVFGISYQAAMLISVLVIVVYTFLGGFLAVCLTDFVQGLLMLVAILTVPIVAVAMMGGISEVNAALAPGFLNAMAEPSGEPISFVSILSQLAWGLGYFGMPHILVRFMAIKSEKSVKQSIVIAIVWVALSLVFAVIIGIVGAAFLPGLDNSERVFIEIIREIFLEQTGSNFILPLIGGFFLCGILAAIMSTADSQLLLTASSVSSDIYKGAINKNADDKRLMWFSRGAVVVVAAIAYFIARDPNSSVMKLVSNAWAGFGAAFGALVLFALYWKRVNRAGAAAGIIAGGLTVIIWEYIPLMSSAAGFVTLSEGTGLYSLVPGFALSALCIVIVSLLTKEPSLEIQNEFTAVATAKNVD